MPPIRHEYLCIRHLLFSRRKKCLQLQMMFYCPCIRSDTRSVFSGVFKVLLDRLPYQVYKPSLPCYFIITGRRIVGFKPFCWYLAVCEIQTTSPKIWTRVAVSISNDVNNYTTDTSTKALVCVCVCVCEYIKIQIVLLCICISNSAVRRISISWIKIGNFPRIMCDLSNSCSILK